MIRARNRKQAQTTAVVIAQAKFAIPRTLLMAPLLLHILPSENAQGVLWMMRLTRNL